MFREGIMIDSMYIVKAEADQIERIVDMSVRAFETDVNVGGTKVIVRPDLIRSNGINKWPERGICIKR